MLTQEQLSAYFADALPPAQRAHAEAAIAADRNAQQTLATQQLMDQALRVAFDGPEGDVRVKLSVLALIRAGSAEDLRAHVLADTTELKAAAPPLPRQIGSRVAIAPGTAARRGTLWEAFLRRINPGIAGPESPLSTRLAALGVVIAAFGFYLLYNGGRLTPAIAIGKLTAVIGTPNLQHLGQSSARSAQPGTSIFLGDRLETSDADRAEIRFLDGTTLRVGLNTTLEIVLPSTERRPPA